MPGFIHIKSILFTTHNKHRNAKRRITMDVISNLPHMSISVSLVLHLVLFTTSIIHTANANPYTIADDRVRNLDITPVLGRGYSVMTDTYQSTCLTVKETTTPSFNYDYTYHDFTTSTSLEEDMASTMGYSLAFSHFRTSTSTTTTTSTQTQTTTKTIFAVMRIERYYSSIIEQSSEIIGAYKQLLDRRDYVGFFKSCGPTYIRGIRRVQEVTARLEFESSSTETTTDYVSNVQVQSGPWYYESKDSGSSTSGSKFNSISSSLQITIVGYGLGLTQEGTETLIASSLAEFKNVMKFAFKIMVNGEDSARVGMVYGFEVRPWAENTKFLLLAGLQNDIISLPLERSLIPRAFRITDRTDTDFVRSERDEFICRIRQHSIDKHGYCCPSNELYNKAQEEYDPFNPETKICRPVRVLPEHLARSNMVQNGEFVARLDLALRYKTNQFNTLEKCISAVHAIPSKFDFYVLKRQDTSDKYTDRENVLDVTPFELKIALDPFNDYGLLRHIGRELNEWIEMFYSRCMGALFGSNIGKSSQTNPSYFMAYPWYSHDECNKLACLTSSVRWDRRDGPGGCVPGMMRGATVLGYDWDDANCAKDTETGGSGETCKYDSEDLYRFHDDARTCWSETLPSGGIDYLMSQYCMPEITAQTISTEDANRLTEAYNDYCLENPNSNAPSVYPSMRPSVKLSSAPSSQPSLSSQPSVSSVPSSQPSLSANPSQTPSQHPSEVPSTKPSEVPSSQPSLSANPSQTPSQHPSEMPSTKPSEVPSANPSQHPSDVPSAKPSQHPSEVPTGQ